MMMLSVRDVKADTFSPPFGASNLGSGLRSFQDVVQSPQSSINRHPEDYQLYELGQFDEQTGKFTIHPQPVFLANATDFVSHLPTV